MCDLGNVLSNSGGDHVRFEYVCGLGSRRPQRREGWSLIDWVATISLGVWKDSIYENLHLIAAF